MTSIGQNIEALCNEHGLDRDLIIEAMTEAVQAAARKQFKQSSDSIEVAWNNEDGAIEISAHKTVVREVENPMTELSLDEAVEMTGDDEIEPGDMLLIPMPMDELGRIAAQTAKQILVQKVREALREKVYEEYVDKIGNLVNGVVKRFERGDIIVDLGNNFEAILPRNQQPRSESWNQGERIRVVIEDVSKEARGQQIIVSRTSAALLKRLFEMEVPEIYDDTVTIKSAVREPGDRAKIAVSSNERDVDPVGACVGMKGSRVQSIIKELRGEKIDIIEWSDEPSVFAANALSPAKVSQVRITDINERKMEVIVVEDQLSLAIGKRGQNVRLATRLVGWDIDIKNEEELKKEIAKQMGKMMASGEAVPITALESVSAVHADNLTEKGIGDVETLAKTSVDDLVEILDVSLDEAEKIITSAQSVVAAKDSEETEVSAASAEDGEVEAAATEIQTGEETAVVIGQTVEEIDVSENVETEVQEMEVSEKEVETAEISETDVETDESSENTETEEVSETADEDQISSEPVLEESEDTSTIVEHLTSENIETDEQMKQIANIEQQKEIEEMAREESNVGDSELTEDITEESVVRTEAESLAEEGK